MGVVQLPVIQPSPTPRVPRPEWLKVGLPGGEKCTRLKGLDTRQPLHPVCESARCPNVAECWGHGTATFMILGNLCTRACGFCAVPHGRPLELDTDEPRRVAEAVAQMKLGYAVITSVNRDDLADGGAAIFAATLGAIRARVPGCKVEVLIPDFRGHWNALETVVAARPDVQYGLRFPVCRGGRGLLGGARRVRPRRNGLSDPEASMRTTRLTAFLLGICLFLPAAAGAQEKISVKEIVQRESPAIVSIYNLDARGEVRGTGTGFIVKADGVVITNFHVIEGAQGLLIKLKNAEGYERMWVMFFDPRRDIAVLIAQGVQLPTVSLGDSEKMEQGDWCVAIGNPKGLEHTVSDGLVSALRVIEGNKMFQISVPISPGSSGGP